MSISKIEYEKVEKLLEKYAELDIEIKAYEYQIQTENIKGVSYSDMPGAPLPSQLSPIEQQARTIEKLKSDKLVLEIRKEAIENIFRILDDTENKLIKLKYLQKLSNMQISKQLHMHENSVSAKKKTVLMKLYPYAIKYNFIK